MIEVKKRSTIITDFTDEIGLSQSVRFSAFPGTDMELFRSKARQCINAHADHLAIGKLRRNEPLTASDLAELERLFLEAGLGDSEVIESVRVDGGLGLFVRSLVGLDRKAATEAFSDFLVGGTLTANQLEFVNMLIEHLTAQGVVDPGLLYESPFTDVDPLGVSGVFLEADAMKIADILTAVRRNAAA